jgi:serine-type D-Ala-D-Ala carboxypeptidase (penicillin-binding protein 5/6)
MVARRAIRWVALAGSVGLLGAGGASAAETPAQLAALPAAATVLMLQSSGAIVYARNANAELAIASTTKLMTAYVTLEREPLDARLVEQPYAAGADESLAPVPAGAVLSVADMLRAMLLPSGNNVAYSLSIDVGGTESNFVAMMNAAAAKLHLGRTHYTTPIGLDTPGDNYSTATDLARLARVLMRRPLFREIVDESSARLADGIVVDNRNDLLGAYPWILGVKTGNTADAGECLVGAAKLDGVRLISVVLGSPSEAARDADTLALLRYGLSLYRRAQVTVAGQLYASVPVAGRTLPARLVAQRSFGVVLARTATLHAALVVPSRLVGPIPAGTVEGSVDVTENGRALATVALVTTAAVPAPPPQPLVAHRSPRLAGPARAGAGSTRAPGCSLPVVRARRMRCAGRMQR